MPVYTYSAVDGSGRTENGSVLAATMDAASSQLSARGLNVTSLSVTEQGMGEAAPQPVVQEKKEPPPTDPRSYFETHVMGSIAGGVPLKDLMFFFKQMSAMLNAGINPTDALDTLTKQTKNPKMSAVLQETRQHTLAGREMSVGFQRYPEVFSPIIMSMFRVGERSGLLSEQCALISDFIQRDMELRNMIKRETAYPKTVIWSSIFIITVANAIISSVTKGSGVQIAAPIVVWIVLAIGVVAYVIFTRYGLKHQPVKAAWDSFILAIPGLGGMAQGFAMARWGRAFAAMYKAGVPYGEGVQMAADACGNEALRARMYPAVKEIQEGRSFTEVFAETGAFSPIVLDMTRTGETTGNLDEMLNKASEYYEDEGQTNARKAATILGVVALIFVGIYVGYIAVQFYSGMGFAGQYKEALEPPEN